MESRRVGSLGSAADDVHDGAPAPERGLLSAAEIRRKLLHMLPGLLPFAFASIPHRDPLSPTAKGIVLIAAAALTLFVLSSRRGIARAHERGWIARVLSYPATMLATLFLFPAHAEFAAAALVVLAFGDGAASLAGLALPNQPLPWNPRKTWAGLLFFVICSAPLAIVAYWREAQPAAPFMQAVACGGTASLAGAVAESVASRINDNLRVGAAASVAVALAYLAFGRSI